MTTLPAVVTIVDLPTATTLLTSAFFEAAQTTNGQVESVKASVAQIAAAVSSTIGVIPAGGGTGQLLNKLSGADFSAGWVNIASALVASTGISIAGSTTATIALASTTPLSVLSVAGAATAVPLPVAGTAAQVLRLNDAGTVVGFGTVNLGSAAAVSGTLPVLFGGIGMSALATGDILYASNSTTLARLAISTAGQVLQVGAGATTLRYGAINLTTAATGVLTVPFGGTGTSTLTAFGAVFGNGSSTLGITGAGTTAWALLGAGTSVAPSFQQVNLTLSVTGTLTVPFGGIGTAALTAFAVIVGGTNATAPLQAIASTGGTGAVLTSNGPGVLPSFQSGAGSGDVVGPSGATDLALAAFNGTTGKVILNTPVTINTTSGKLTGAQFGNAGLKVEDTNASNVLIITPGSDLSSDRVLTITTGDAARTVTLSGNPTLNDWFDQSVKTSATVTHTALVITSTGATAITVGAVNLTPNIPQTSQAAAYTAVLADANTQLLHPLADGTNRIFTIPANASVAYPIGTCLTFVNQTATLTLAINSDTMVLAGSGSTGSRTIAANGMASVIKINATTWFLSGTGVS